MKTVKESMDQFQDPNRLIRLREVLKLVPVAASTWWVWVSQGKAPTPIRLGRCTCWRYGDLLALIEKSKEQGGCNEK